MSGLMGDAQMWSHNGQSLSRHEKLHDLYEQLSQKQGQPVRRCRAEMPGAYAAAALAWATQQYSAVQAAVS